MTAKQILTELKRVADEEKAKFLPGFFQAVPGGYGEGDRFLGCVVPAQRRIASAFRDLSRDELIKLFRSPWHECRLTGMFILVRQYERAAKAKNPNRESDCQEIVSFYMDHLEAVNNWDIVDGTAPKILGPWLLENRKERKILTRLSKSNIIWERRVAVLATFPLIRNDEFDEIIALTKRLISDPHDLMHKAIGWMLREMGKRDVSQLESILAEYAPQMPRTMLRYAIEKLPKQERTKWLNA